MKNLKIGTKIIGIVALLCGITCLLVAFSSFRMSGMSQSYESVIDGPSAEAVHIARANRYLMAVRYALYGVIAETDQVRMNAMSD
jgi:hypothetical protein